MKIVIIDGQGGRIGSLLIEKIKTSAIHAEVIAVGTNSTATAAMLRAGADAGATGENPVIVNCRDADYIMGPIGIIAADSLLGEVTPAMACAIASSPCEKILLPVNKCSLHIVGSAGLAVPALITEATAYLQSLLS
jgi:hypothetical protein